jgi:hypothetical protein
MEPVLVTEGKPLSQLERVVDTYVAPSKTFTDILRSTSWWMPFLIIFIMAAGSAFAIDHAIGFDRVSEQQIANSPKSEERMAQLAPEQRARQMKITAAVTKNLTYVGGVFFLIFVAFGALLNWASMNFGFGAKTTFGQNFAVGMYAALPLVFMYLLNIILVYAGVNTENFDLKNPVGTNIGYYLPATMPALKALLEFFDIFRLWSLALTVLGTSIIARRTIGQAAIVVLGWWLLTVLVVTGITAVTT